MRAMRSPRVGTQCPPEFAQQPVCLPVVAPRAAGDTVLPRMGTTTTARHDVVDRLRLVRAVHAPEAIPVHEACPGEGYFCPIRNSNITTQPDHRRHRHRDCGRMQHQPGGVAVHHLGLAAHDQHHRAPQRQRGQRLKCRVEQQHPASARWPDPAVVPRTSAPVAPRYSGSARDARMNGHSTQLCRQHDPGCLPAHTWSGGINRGRLSVKHSTTSVRRETPAPGRGRGPRLRRDRRSSHSTTATCAGIVDHRSHLKRTSDK